jgi:3-methyladenine DNA glycosylase/8-oxoguanine DNA glycosylase
MSDTQVDVADARAALRASDPVLARLIDGLEPVDLASWRAHWGTDDFRALARSIVGQQIATRAATAIFDRLQSLIGDRDPATAIVEASDAELRTVVSRRPRRRRYATWPHGRSMAGSNSTGWGR